MTEIIKNRTIRPSTRLKSSKSYKVETKNVGIGDILIVNIDHESTDFFKTFKFYGDDITNKNTISFRVYDYGTSIEIIWSRAQPFHESSYSAKNENIRNIIKAKQKQQNKIIEQSDIKTSFNPISNSETEILILGTIPGDKSIELGEYYGHPRNRFWEIISTITENDKPIKYNDKKELLLKTKFGIWDVAHKVNRTGSLDSKIKNEKPNDLNNFVEEHKHLKVIGFNGQKAKELFNKHFERKKQLKYISLPSTSPANTRYNLEDICNEWRKLIE